MQIELQPLQKERFRTGSLMSERSVSAIGEEV